jgi:hypothetical protein
MVEDGVLFMPTEELMQLIATIFRGLANPYLTDNVDGITLLAARNLLVQVVAFYSYYGRHQIYNMLKRSGVSVSTRGVVSVIRREIAQVFAACQDDNRLMLRRVMRDAAQEFEMSVEAIQREAEVSAIEAVQAMAPTPRQTVPKKKRAWWRRFLGLK